MPWKYGFGGVARMFWEMACVFFSVLCREKHKKGEKNTKKDEKGRENRRESARKKQQNADFGLLEWAP